MINLKNLPYKTIAVLGLARSGMAGLQALQDSGISVRAWDDNKDSRQNTKDKGFGILSLEDGLLDGADALLISPGIPHTLPEAHPIAQAAKDAKLPIITDISLYAETRDIDQTKLFAVTGTNGKSTTTTLLAYVLNDFYKTEAAGNIGRAVLSLSNEIECAVLELSSYQTELTDNLNADGVIWLNITPDHLDRHGDMDGYVDAKLKIFERHNQGGIAVIACDDKYSRNVADKISKDAKWKVVCVSTTEMVDDGVSVLSGNLYEKGEVIGSISSAENLKGTHNHQNAACVYALVREFFDKPPQEILDKIISFEGLEHRQKKVTEFDGVSFINDSKATNADATSKALSSFDNIYWLAGGLPKEGGISSLTKYFPKIKKAYFYGQSGKDFQDFAVQNNLNCALHETLGQALENAYEEGRGQEGVTILLSPACASFDQYESFEKRGQHFIDLVEKLKK